MRRSLLIVLLTAACVAAEPGVAPPPDALLYPTSAVMHPDGRTLAVVSANFNLSYRNGTINLIDLTSRETEADGPGRIVRAWTTEIGTFAGEAAFHPSGRRLYAVARGDYASTGESPRLSSNRLYVYEVDNTKTTAQRGRLKLVRTLQLAADPYGVRVDPAGRFVYVTHLSNGETSVIQTQPGEPVDPALKVEMESPAADSTSPFVLKRFCVPRSGACAVGTGALSCAPADEVPCDDPASPACVRCPADRPAFRFYGRYDRPEPAVCLQPCDRDADCGGAERCIQIRPEVRVDERKFERGANSVAFHPATGSVYVGQRDSPNVGILRPFEREGRDFDAEADLIGLARNFDVRGLLFLQPDPRTAPPPEPRPGETPTARVWLYAATANAQQNPGLTIVDVTERPETFRPTLGRGIEDTREIGFIPTCGRPSDIERIENLLVVSCFSDDALAVIDANAGAVIDTVRLESARNNQRTGPYDLTAFTVETPDGGREHRLAVVLFSQHEVTVFRVRPDDPARRFERVVRIHNRPKLY